MINSDTPRTSYTLSSDATTSSTYATPAPIYGADDVKVYVNNVLQTSSSPQQYSVTVASDNTATISFTSSHLPVSGAVIGIIRSLAYLQEANFVNNDALDIENVETGLDKVTVLAQQLADGKDYSFKFASYLSGATGFDSTVDTASTLNSNKSARASKALRFDSDGNVGISVHDPDEQATIATTQANSAILKASEAAVSASSASTSENNASASATSASASAANAATSETNAFGYKNSAAASASSASASAIAMAIALGLILTPLLS